MEIILAESAGFCFGVQRAVDMVEKEIEKGDFPIYTYGPIIHNEQVTEDFRKKGVEVLSEDVAPLNIQEGTVVLRSHGVSKAVRDSLESRGFTISDATCPFVLKIHKAVQKYSEFGHFIIIIGNDGIRRRVRENKYESLRDRIVTNYEMKSLTSDEASEYIKARIAAVGGNPDMFNKQVLNAICHVGRGNARRINTLATNLLMLGYTQKKTEFDVEDVKMARDEMSI